MFRYELDKSSKKFHCPQCGQKRFVKYRDLLTEEYLSEEYGRCDRVNNCQYHNAPKNEPLHKEIKTAYKPLEAPDSYDLSQKVIDYFGTRKISLNTLKRFGVTGNDKAIHFNYFREGDELFNIKKRFPGKRWTLEGGAEMNFYNYDALADDVVYITEGEIDALTVYEVDPNISVVSLPNGANSHKFLDGQIESLESKEFVLCMDSDDAGTKGRNDLMVRFGPETGYISYPDDCKDINEVLVKHGKEKALECLKRVHKKPIKSVHSAEDYESELDDYITNGFPKGLTSNNPELDHLLTPLWGQFIVLSGTPNSGKSPLLDYLIVQWKKYNEGVRPGYISAEMDNAIQIMQIANHWLQKDIIGTGDYSDDVLDVMNMIKEDYQFVDTVEVDSMHYKEILKIMQSMNKRFGTNLFVVDPFNYLEKDGHEHSSIAPVLRGFANFAKKYNSLVFMVAHPRKMSKDDDGNYDVVKPYDISGSSDFYNIADCILSFWRDFVGTENQDEYGNVSRKYETNKLYCQKLKQYWLGQCPSLVNIKYNTATKSFNII